MNAAKLLFLIAGIAAAQTPAGYRRWTHVKSAMLTAPPSESGLHHIYANAKAVEGYETGTFPEGATIVYELLETLEQKNVVSEGPRRRVDVMIKDSTRYKTTGGWGFQRFLSSNPTQDAAEGSTCFSCHNRVKDTGFVFSRIRP